ncbi:MAG: hypothetical protein WAQ98_11125 [Blastocatellia bacterium]
MANFIRTLKRVTNKPPNRGHRRDQYKEAVSKRVSAFEFIARVWRIARSVGCPVEIDPKKLDLTPIEEVKESPNGSELEKTWQAQQAFEAENSQPSQIIGFSLATA